MKIIIWEWFATRLTVYDYSDMKCIILAAGYATRLYPLTENFPKPLLEVGGKTIVDWLVDDISASGSIDEFIVISNHKFESHFSRWAKERTGKKKITVIDDGTDSNDSRLGAVLDIKFAVDRLGLDDDLLIIAGDNVLDFSLSKFIKYAAEKKTSCIMRYYEPVETRLHKCGVLDMEDNSDLVKSMEEKPAEPKSHWCCPPFYIYTREDIKFLAEGITSGCSTDTPGSFAAWLAARKPVHAMEMPGSRYDIGNLESYRLVQTAYHGITEK